MKQLTVKTNLTEGDKIPVSLILMASKLVEAPTDSVTCVAIIESGRIYHMDIKKEEKEA